MFSLPQGESTRTLLSRYFPLNSFFFFFFYVDFSEINDETNGHIRASVIGSEEFSWPTDIHANAKYANFIVEEFFFFAVSRVMTDRCITTKDTCISFLSPVLFMCTTYPDPWGFFLFS